MNLRSISHALTAILAGEEKGKKFAKETIKKVIVRADDITEILSCYISMYGKPIANSLKKGIADAMQNFDEYSFAKYDSNNKKIKFRDVLRITHPKAKNDEQNSLFKAILDKTLETPYTWETELSSKGNTKEVWETLIATGKVGTMALLRNLKNILIANPDNINLVHDRLRNENEILKSKLLPFRFFSAYKKLKQEHLASSKILDTLEIAIKHSTKNIEKLKGKTLIAIDVSESMTRTISNKSEVMCSDIACLMGSMANSICEDAIVLSFDTSIYDCQVSSINGIIANANSINVNGGGTDISLPLKYILQKNIKVDRIIMLSDNEINSGFNASSYYNTVPCQSVIEQYKKSVNSDVWVHAIDLQGYGTQQFIGENVNILAGWNEKVFEFINLTEQGYSNLVKTIENYNNCD